ncbi:Spy/CpxP family protein refolding chaperone [Bradyrhizobium sp. HKCCYLS1011]|uniref:Spy/CpxP family protein refolding chaperone n=1 Tax=Bradyrhizobium sp. HKCCYLS1011 TaxID=3420733 RepID=UPI003EB76C1E
MRGAPGGVRHGFAGHAPSGRSFAGHNAPVGRIHAPAGIAAGNRAAPNSHVVSNRMMLRDARAVGHALSSRQVRTAMHAPGGLRNPARRAAITAAVAGAAFAHHHGGFWWRHAHGGFGWVGPVFWPYAYDDFYDYAWWGGDYYPFWDYGYGDLYAGLFGPYDYGSLNAYARYLPETTGSTRPAHAAKNEETSTLADMCGSDSKTIAGFPVEQFRSAIQPNAEQAAALDDLANASQKAAELIRNSCPKDVALTAPSRLAAMQQRVQAMRDAVNIVKPPLDRFYGLLSDDQKAKITALAAEQRTARRGDTNASGGSCTADQSATTSSAMPWPSDQIERDVKPTDAQRASLTALQDATTKAADILKSSCPPTEARTPPARLDAVGARLDAMLQALGTVRPALDTFYNSLSDEQKAAFDAIGPARNGPSTASADEDETPRRSRHRHHHGVSVRSLVFRMMGL